jgi:phage shock protein PspC (stress-responsive transcriptional regulator)
MTARRLKRSQQDRLLFGVAGGIADYFDIDPVLVRVGFVLLTLVNGLGLVGYVILAIVTPKADTPPATTEDTVRRNLSDMPQEVAEAGRRAGERLGTAPATDTSRWLLVLGVLIVAIGFIVLFATLGIGWVFFAALWPVSIIIVGVLLLLVALRRQNR